LFLVLDSDDGCVFEALQRLKSHWDRIPLAQREKFCGVTGLCVAPDGHIVGPKFPQDEIDSDFIEMGTRYSASGERWGFHRTDVLREFLFPEIPGERFISEGLVWNRIARRYKTRYVNEIVRVYYDSPDGLMAATVRIRARNPIGARLYYREFLDLPVSWRWIARNLVNYVRFSLHAGLGWMRIVSESGRRGMATALFPLGYLAFRRDLTLLARQASGAS
jgi:hypothetical protein